MKTRHLALLIGAGMLASLTSFMLYQVRGMLPQIAGIYIILTCLLLALAAACILAWLLKNLYRHVNDMLLATQARAEKVYELTERQERWRLEQEERRVAMHIQLSRVQPGTYLIRPEMVLSPSEQDVILLPGAGQARNNSPLALPSPGAGQGGLPEKISYESIKHLIPAGQALLGVSEAGHVATCGFEQLMTMWICGGSSTGKSNTVALKIDEAIRNGRDIRLVVIDPHAKKEDSLYNKIRMYEDRFLFRVAITESEILATLQWYHQEFKRRLAQGGADTDLLLVCDEVSNVVASEDQRIKPLVKEIARICGQESRGFGMFGWFISQKAAGLAWLRNVVITVIAHKMVMMSERILAANDDRAIARSMDAWPRGRVVVYGVEFEPQVYQMPIFTPSGAPAPGQLGMPGQPGKMEVLSSLNQEEADAEEADYYEEEEDTEQDTEDLPIDENLREALDAWNAGAQGPRPMQRALGVTYYQAQKLCQELQEKGLIETD